MVSVIKRLRDFILGILKFKLLHIRLYFSNLNEDFLLFRRLTYGHYFRSIVVLL